ncbi:hypothetical protein AB0R12_36200, partial [Streptomyces niveus]|uniref:hypothetical protein n=1 Tax=Streptomyces niveus TaxID=193462 RepID=UPI0034491591
GRSAGLGASAPSVARWLGDIRTYFGAGPFACAAQADKYPGTSAISNRVRQHPIRKDLSNHPSAE